MALNEPDSQSLADMDAPKLRSTTLGTSLNRLLTTSKFFVGSDHLKPRHQL